MKTSTYHKNYINGCVCVSVKMAIILGCGYAECTFRECEWYSFWETAYAFYTYMKISKRKRHRERYSVLIAQIRTKVRVKLMFLYLVTRNERKNLPGEYINCIQLSTYTNGYSKRLSVNWFHKNSD